MAQINIDRLSLKLSGISAIEGQQLARLVAQKLANSDVPSLADSDRPTVQITIPSPANGSIDWLANQIVAEVLRQLNQTLA